ncbi:MAG: maltose acetyltransferase domain-containing protein [Rikenellaceae bacterium]
MAEKEKMIKGELYDAGDVTLVKERGEIMRKLLGGCKGSFTIEPNVWFD